MTRSQEIQAIIGLKLQAIQIIHESAHSKILAKIAEIKELSEELHRIETGCQPDNQISLTERA